MDLSSLAPRADLLAAAVVLDLAVGDPVYRWHPIRLIGGSLTRFEKRLRAVGADGHIGGCALFVMLALLWGGGAAALVVGAARLHPAAAGAVHLFLLYSLIALGDLLAHAGDVDAAVTAGDLPAARVAAGRLVGRDTAPMDGPACRRSAIESLGESLVDGVVSPIFWYALGGIPGIVLFKIVSTMDSMVGYRTERYRRFGWCGARLDDLLNLVPARVTWLLIAGAAVLAPGASGREALRLGLAAARRRPGAERRLERGHAGGRDRAPPGRADPVGRPPGDGGLDRRSGRRPRGRSRGLPASPSDGTAGGGPGCGRRRIPHCMGKVASTPRRERRRAAVPDEQLVVNYAEHGIPRHRAGDTAPPRRAPAAWVAEIPGSIFRR